MPQIENLLPKEVDTFVDLFGGGFTVGINVEAKRVVYNEIIPEVVELMQLFADEPVEEFIKKVDGRITEYQLTKENEAGYLRFRQQYNKHKTALDLYVLICYSFNNQIRYNKKREYNNAFGRARGSFNPKMREKLVKFVTHLQEKNVTIQNKSYKAFDYSNIGAQDLIYCDPPYLLGKGTYNVGWGEQEDKDLMHMLDELNQKGLRFALSNVLEHKGVENKVLIEWSKKYNVYELDHTYANCNYQTNKRENKSSKEVLITNYTATN